MLAVAGVVALSSQPETGLVVVIVCVVGAVATVAAGCWQSAKFVAARAGAGGLRRSVGELWARRVCDLCPAAPARFRRG